MPRQLDGPIVLVGPTATGKSAAAIELALRLGGEVISADSMCIYRGMDIGTAKPTLAERRGVPHHLIDLVAPDEPYSVARFLDDAAAALAEIQRRGRPAIVAGGSGYWVRALLGGATSAAVPPDPDLRRELAELLEREGPDALVERLRRLDSDAVARIDLANPRRVTRAIEVVLATGRPFAEARRGETRVHSACLFGLTLPRDVLYTRIDARYDQMVRAGWLEEVGGLLARGYGRDLPAMRGLGYRELAAHLAGELTLTEALARAKARCRRYARGQYAWFRPDDPEIVWIDARTAVVDEILRRPGEQS